MRTALATGDYQTLLQFLTTTFDSFSEMTSVFMVWQIQMIFFLQVHFGGLLALSNLQLV